MTDRELILQNRVADLEQLLRAMQQKYDELTQSLVLSQREREVLAGREDGQIPVGLVRPIFRRVFGKQVA